MATSTELQVSRRELMGKASKRLRKAGMIPANLTGHNQEAQPLQVSRVLFENLVRHHQANGVIALKVEGSGVAESALIRHVQHDPRTGKPVHIDFDRVSMNEKISVNVQLTFVGAAPGVTLEGGVLLPLQETLHVECATKDLPGAIEVDLSSLTELNSILHAKDIKLPASVTLVTDPEENIVKVNPPTVLTAEEEAPTTEEAGAAEAAPAEESEV